MPAQADFRNHSTVGVCLCPLTRRIRKVIQHKTAGHSVMNIDSFNPNRKAFSANAAERSAVVHVLSSSSQIHPPV